jgi:hypothetical protein
MLRAWSCIVALLLACSDDVPPGDVAEVDVSLEIEAEAEVEAEIVPEEVAEEVTVVPDRARGERAPLSARCDDIEPTRCFLPWPSSAFLVADATRDSGVRMALATDELPADEGTEHLLADGFSRVSPIVTVLPAGVATEDVRMRAFVAEPGDFGREIPIDSLIVPGRFDDPTSIVGYPFAPMPAATEIVVIVEAPTAIAALRTPAVAIGLGLQVPATAAERRRAAYFAPARELLAPIIDADRVLAMWDFVTRSAEDPRVPLRTMASHVKAQIGVNADITITSAVTREGPIALVVEGRIEGLIDDVDMPAVTYGVPFRVVVPAGEGDYRIVMYAHGTSGDVRDSSFDELIASSGAAKINTEIDGWSGDTVVQSLSGLFVPIAGTRALTLRMRRAIAGISAIQAAVLGPLGDLLAAPTIGGIDNPTAGRRPWSDRPIWAGGSLGGVIGCVYGHLEPTIVGGVLNVPGAAFTHWLARSSIGEILDIALTDRYPAMVDQQIAASMAQTLWDEVDGAIWAGARQDTPIFVVQMSVGDPIMPNIGTAMVATALDVVHLLPDGAEPLLLVPGLERAPFAEGRSALTEFVTNETGTSEVHGFAARDAPAGVAARAQFEAFIRSLWAGAPRIDIPEACMPLPEPGICDFATTSP